MFPVPMVPRDVLMREVTEAVRASILWLISGPTSVFKEEIPLGVLTDIATLNPPPPDIPATAVLPQNLQAAWAQELTTAAAIASALSAAQGKQIPWPTVSVAIEGAVRGRLLERTEDSGPWPCEWAGAANVLLRIPKDVPPIQPSPPPPSGRKYAETELEPGELQDLVDGLGDIVKAGAGLDLRFVVRVELSERTTDSEQVGALNEALAKASTKLQIQ